MADPPIFSGAVYRPVSGSTSPTPPGSTLHASPSTGWPNWSRASAANCCCAPAASATAAGVTVTVAVRATVTATSFVTALTPSLTVHRRAYSPAIPNVATLALAAFVPLAPNATAGAPFGAPVTDQV